MQNIFDLEKHTLQGVDVYFDPDKHKYYIGGKEVMGVTKSADMAADTNYKTPWGASAAAKEADKIFAQKRVDELLREKYFDRIRYAWLTALREGGAYGNITHAFLEKYSKWKLGQLDEPPEKLDSSSINKTAKSFTDWAKKNKIIWTAAEQVVMYQDLDKGFRYCGTLDIRFEINGLKAIGDFKTGKKIGVNHAWQLAMYAMAVEQCFDERIDLLYLFHLPKPGGRKKIKVVKFSRDQFCWEMAPYLARLRAEEFKIKKAMKDRG